MYAQINAMQSKYNYDHTTWCQVSLSLWCDTKSHIWLIGEEEYLFDQSQRSPAGTLGGMLAARCAVGMKPF